MPENPRLEELRRRVQADPASIAFAALAEEYRRTGRFDEAIETCRTGLQRHPAYLSARVTLGRALIEMGALEAAREELETVLRSAPENLAAIRGLAQIHDRLGQSAEMHPDLHALAQEPIRLAAESRARQAEAPPPAPAPAAEPIDMLSAALKLPAPPPIAFEAATIAFEAPVVVRTDPAAADSAPEQEPEPGPLPGARAAADPPSVPLEAAVFADRDVAPDGPDPYVAAMLVRLERFLGAIESARHA